MSSRYLGLGFSSVLLFLLGVVLHRVWIGNPSVDPYRTLELEAYTNHLRQNGGLLVKTADSGNPSTRIIEFNGKSVVGWDDDPMPYLGSGWISLIRRSLSALESFGIWSELWYGAGLVFGVALIFLFFKATLNPLAATLSVIGTLVVGLFSWQNNSLPFSNVGFTPEIIGAGRRDAFIENHNPWERVDTFYGLGSTVFAACLSLILILAILRHLGKLRSLPNWILVITLAFVLILAELSRLGSSLILAPATLFAISTIYPTHSKVKTALRAIAIVAVIPLLRTIVLTSFAIVREIQSGIPWNSVPFSSSSAHRILLGLSFNPNGSSQPGLGGVTWSDNEVIDLVSSDKNLIFLTPEYNSAAFSLFLKIVFEQPVEYLFQIFSKISLALQFFETRLAVIAVLSVVLLFLKPQRLNRFSLTILGTLAITAILGFLPILASRPFSLFLFYLKPVLDVALALLVGLLLSTIISRLKVKMSV